VFKRSGISTIEILTVIALLVIIGGITIANIFGRKGRSEIDSATKQIVALLREAQSRSVSQASSTSWGVHFENGTGTAPFYALFPGQYASTTRLGSHRLPVSVRYATATLALGSSTDIVFSQIVGRPQATTSIGLELVGGGNFVVATSAIRVNNNGSVEY